MNSNPYVRVIRAFGQYRVGDTFCPPGTYRDMLVMNGYVEIIKPQDAAPPIKAEVQLPRSSRAKRKGISAS